jgi:hypothetical protein
MRRASRNLTAWIAIFSIILASLIPAISYAIVSAQGAGALWTEVCSSQGLKAVNRLDDQNSLNSSAPDYTAAHTGHCPFCFIHADFFVVPSPLFFPPAVKNSTLSPTLFYQSHSPLFIWTSAQSRAPPFIS